MRIVPLALTLALAACSREGVQAKPKAPPPPTGIGIGDAVPQFAAETVSTTGATDVSGTFDSHVTKGVTVYAFLGTHCPTTQMYLDRLREVEGAYRAKGVSFVYIYPNRNDPSDGKRAYHRAQRFVGPMIDDVGAKIAVDTLGAHKTSEMLVVDADGVIRYRGSIDDNKDAQQVTRRHLALALDEVLAGKPVTMSSTNVFA